MVDPNLEIRFMESSHLYQLVEILGENNVWKKLMSILPVDNDPKNSKLMFSPKNIDQIEKGARMISKPAAQQFLEEWGTWGRNLATVQIMLDFLVKAELFRAADFVAVTMLKQNPPERPKTGPAARVDTSDEAIREILRQQLIKRKDQPASEPPSYANFCNIIERPNDNAQAQNADTTSNNESKPDLIEFSRDFIEFSDTSAGQDTNDFVLQALPAEDLPIFLGCQKDFKPVPFDMSDVDTIDLDLSQLTTLEMDKAGPTLNQDLSSSEPIIESEDKSDDQYLPIIPNVVMEFNKKVKS